MACVDATQSRLHNATSNRAIMAPAFGGSVHVALIQVNSCVRGLWQPSMAESKSPSRSCSLLFPWQSQPPGRTVPTQECSWLEKVVRSWSNRLIGNARGEDHFVHVNVHEPRVFVQWHVLRARADGLVNARFGLQVEQGELGAEQRGVAGGDDFFRRKVDQPDAAPSATTQPAAALPSPMPGARPWLNGAPTPSTSAAAQHCSSCPGEILSDDSC